MNKESAEHENKIISTKVNDCSNVPFQYQAAFWTQMRALLWRELMSGNRKHHVSSMRIISAIIAAFTCGVIFYGQREDQDGIENINGAIFFAVLSTTYNSIAGAIYTFPNEFSVFLKEHKAGIYRIDIYFLSKTLPGLPWFIITPAVFVSILYWMIGLHDNVATFFTFYALILLTSNCGLSFGYFVSCMSPNIQVSIALGPNLMIPFMLVGGFFIKDSSIPHYIKPLKWLSWFKYAFECLIINQWQNVTSIDCGKLHSPANKTMTCSSASPYCVSNGMEVIKQMGYDAGNMERNIGSLFALLL